MMILIKALNNMPSIRFIVISILLLHNAYAYLDPGTGSALGYLIIGLLAAMMHYFQNFYFRLKSWVLGRQTDRSLSKPADNEIVFHSEGRQYWTLFLPVIQALESYQVACTYYTMDEEDPGLKANFPYLHSAYIGKNLSAFMVLNHLHAKMLVTTTPQLDVMQFKRSLHVKHYAHLIHAPTDVLLYKPFSFDHFDSILCSGPHQIENLRLMEKRYQLKPKNLYETGLTYFDILPQKKQRTDAAKKQDVSTNKKNSTILIAPTWGDNSLLTLYGSKPILALIQQGYQVILRPHPQMYVSQIQLIQSIETELQNQSNVEIDRKNSAEESMVKADLLISDISGIIFDFLFIHKKPIGVSDTGVRKDGTDGFFLDNLSSWEEKMLETIAVKMDLSDDTAFLKQVKLLLKKNLTNSKDMLETLCHQSLYHLGTAGTTAASQLHQILKTL